ncbi:MAG TPA: hypothetical protein VIF62_09795 [Labilithrix sp.]
MRRLQAFALACVALAATYACGLSVTGSMEVGADAAAPTAPATEGGATGDGGDSLVVVGGDSDAAVGVPFDAGAFDASCDATTIDDPLTSLGPAWLVSSDNNPSHPAVVQLQAGSKKFDAISLVAQDQDSARGAIWLASPVPTQALDVQFQYAAGCGNTGWFSSSCADGFAAVWVGDNATNVATTIAGATSGASFGVPPGQNGAGVAVDIYQNSSLGDPGTPALELLAIDGTKTPGSYKWAVQGQSGDGYGNYSIRTVNLHLRSGALSVSVDGKPVFTNVAVHPTQTSAFGFTAATGGENGRFYAWDFHAAFFACANP